MKPPFIEKANWNPPSPIIEKMSPEKYPISSLPIEIRDVVEEVTKFLKTPVEMVASSFLCALSLAAQGQVDVQRANQLEGPVSLDILIVADSGERKTAIDNLPYHAQKFWE